MTRSLITVFILASLVSGPVISQESNSPQFEAYKNIARWMAEQPDPKMRAAGWSYLAKYAGLLGEVDRDEYLDQVRGLLGEQPSPAVLYFLAQGCKSLGVLGECSDAGLPEAVRQHAGGNPLILRFLHEPGSTEFRNLLIEADSLDAYLGLESQLWYRALTQGPHEAPKGLSNIQTALGVGMVSYEGLNQVVESCRQVDDGDEGLQQACERFSTRLLESKTVLLQNLGLGLEKERAFARGDHERVGELLRRQEALEGRLMCLVQAATPALDNGDETLHTRFLEILAEQGEIAAFDFAAGDQASECSSA